MDYALKNHKPTEVFYRNNIQPIFSMFLLHSKSVLRYLLYYVHLYHVLTLSLPSRAVSIIFHYPASLCYAGLIVKSLVCIMSTISILCLHNCHVINNIKSNVDSSSPNGSLLCRMSPSRTELFVYLFKLIPVYYYEYACVCERVDSICMSDWWGDCGGGFTSTREDVNGVEYQVVGSGRVSRNTHVCIRSYHFYVLTTINDQVLFVEMKLCLVINCLITSLLSLIFDWKTFETSGIIINHSYLWSYVQLIFITPYYYYFDISIVYNHLHIIFHIFISLKWLTMGLLKRLLTYSSITMVTPEYHFFLFLLLLCSHQIQMSIYRPMSFLLNKFLHMHDHNDKLYCHIHVLERT